MATNQKKTGKSNTKRTSSRKGVSVKKNIRTTAEKKQKVENRNKSYRKRTNQPRIKSYQEEEHYESAMIQEALLFAVSAAALLLALSNFGICGQMGKLLSSFMFGLFGITAYVFPFLLFFGVLFLMSNLGNGKAKIKFASASAVYVAVCAMLQQMMIPFEKGTSLIACYLLSASQKKGGGLVGAWIGHLLIPIIGVIGMYVLLGALILAGVVLITEKSVIGGVKKHGKRMVHSAADMAHLAEVRRAQNVENRQGQIRASKKVKGIVPSAVTTLDDKQGTVIKGKKPHIPEDGYLDDILEENVKKGKKNSNKNRQEGLHEVTVPYEGSTIFGYEDDGVLQNPLAPSSEVRKEEPPADMTVYQNVGGESQMISDLPLEMTPFPTVHSSKKSNFDRKSKSSHQLKEKQKEETFKKQEKQYLKKEEKQKEKPLEKNYQEIQKQKESEKELLFEERNAQTVSNDVWKNRIEVQELTDTWNEKEDEMVFGTIWNENKEEVPSLSLEEKNDGEQYQFPPLSLLKKGAQSGLNEKREQEKNEVAQKLETTLRNFGVGVEVTDVTSGPTVTRYELLPAQGVKVSRIVALADDIKLSLAASDIRIEAPIPGKSAVGIEVPNKENATVMLRDLLESDNFQYHKSKLAFAVGKDIGGQTIVTDIAKMPHALIAGATGSGKSVCINTLIMSILYKAHPDDVKLIMIDPKVVELSVYNGIPHLLIPVVTDPKKAAGALNWAVAEMGERYKKFSEYNVRNIQGYNEKVAELQKIDTDKTFEKMPQIVIIIDELADLMMVASNEVEESICRLAQLARAAGIHLIIATQRPSVNVITGLIKANIPSRIAFAVSSGVDSRTILDTVGAEKLLGKGDMLFAPYGSSSPVRIQGAFVSDREVGAVVEFLKNQQVFVSKNQAVAEKMMTTISNDMGSDGLNLERDDYFMEAARLILQTGKASISMLQRKFKIGFNRAARIMDQLADAGVVGPEEGTKQRKILMSEDEFEQCMGHKTDNSPTPNA